MQVVEHEDDGSSGAARLNSSSAGSKEAEPRASDPRAGGLGHLENELAQLGRSERGNAPCPPRSERDLRRRAFDVAPACTQGQYASARPPPRIGPRAPARHAIEPGRPLRPPAGSCRSRARRATGRALPLPASRPSRPSSSSASSRSWPTKIRAAARRHPPRRQTSSRTGSCRRIACCSSRRSCSVPGPARR